MVRKVEVFLCIESYIAFKDHIIKELEPLALKWNLEEKSNLLK